MNKNDLSSLGSNATGQQKVTKFSNKISAGTPAKINGPLGFSTKEPGLNVIFIHFYT